MKDTGGLTSSSHLGGSQGTEALIIPIVGHTQEG